jgi:transcriptional regulator with XRE-family HTH domain
MQRHANAHSRAAARVRLRLSQRSDGAQLRRPVSYPPRPEDAYRVHVSDGATVPGAWATYIAAAAKRPGWNTAKLAAAAGVHRSTVFRWKKGESAQISVASVKAVAQALGDDPAVALRAASELLADADTADRDEEMELIMSADVSAKAKQRMVDLLLRRRDEDRQRRLADLQVIIDSTSAS